jgi:hypothetical protein
MPLQNSSLFIQVRERHTGNISLNSWQLEGVATTQQKACTKKKNDNNYGIQEGV